MWVNALSVACCLAGALFYLAGTVGLLRFPDTWARLHALTKADNLGLGFLVLGLALPAADVAIILKMVLIWLLTLLAGTSGSYLIGRHVLDRREQERDAVDAS
jgi:multicomponent Na+:H+ antiporter subunit G